MKVPKENLVHELNKGWDVAKYLLQHEREMISGSGLRRRWRDLARARGGRRLGRDADGRLDDPVLRARIAQFEVRDARVSGAIGTLHG